MNEYKTYVLTCDPELVWCVVRVCVCVGLSIQDIVVVVMILLVERCLA